MHQRRTKETITKARCLDVSGLAFLVCVTYRKTSFAAGGCKTNVGTDVCPFLAVFGFYISRTRRARPVTCVLLLCCVFFCLSLSLFLPVLFRVVGPDVPDFPLPRKAMEILLQDLEEGFAKLEEDLVNFTGSDAWVSSTLRLPFSVIIMIFIFFRFREKSKN